MNITQTFGIALGALARTKTRSALTVLGVVIGVGAVIAMVSIGEGAKARVAEAFDSMGTNTLIIRAGSTRRGGVRGGAGSRRSITWGDLTAIQSELSSIDKVAPELSSRAQVMSATQNWSTSIVGTTPDWFDVRNWPLASGEIFTHADNKAAKKVAILGTTVVTNLFGEGADPIGETVRINSTPFTVVGVAVSKGASAFGSDNDDKVIIPAQTFIQKLAGGERNYITGSILAATASRDLTEVAKLDIDALLRRRHKLRPGADADFQIRDPAEMAEAQQDSAQTITSLLAGVALVSLLVGGIGIMNIMLVSVTERTREIGLRMAVGAKQGHILAQFLIEAVTLSIIGGLLGIAGGIGAGKYMAKSFGFPLLVRPDIVLLAVAVSAAVGIGFGLYPARKASRLDPITALRYE